MWIILLINRFCDKIIRDASTLFRTIHVLQIVASNYCLLNQFNNNKHENRNSIMLFLATKMSMISNVKAETALHLCFYFYIRNHAYLRSYLFSCLLLLNRFKKKHKVWTGRSTKLYVYLRGADFMSEFDFINNKMNWSNNVNCQWL